MQRLPKSQQKKKGAVVPASTAEMFAGQRVRMTDGPFSGLMGKLIQFVHPSRLIISVTIESRSLFVEIDKDWVVPDGTAEVGAEGERDPRN
jgi:transcription antitermination factor NusG